jgi:hypothetical protein
MRPPARGGIRDESRIFEPIGQILLSNAAKPDMHLAADPNGAITIFDNMYHFERLLMGIQGEVR